MGLAAALLDMLLREVRHISSFCCPGKHNGGAGDWLTGKRESKLGEEGLILMGGDGSYRASHQLSAKHGALHCLGLWLLISP